ncbi:MarR family winged helix-turn-helix transcriptional regulator [Streptomyces sp. NPDC057002]|uniref:MarR family winged helix-turn-helix transcriptional regulator n=1 Tax=Streptomyces sp. NPDC057002 TaxID=3345992 RepID=UPI0036403C0F
MTDGWSREESLGYQMNHLARLFAQALAVRIASLGVVPGQFAQLLVLFEQDGLSQRELCDRVRIEQPTMANTLRRMERDGLVRRVSDPSDRRRTHVLLTERARGIEKELISAADTVNAAATEGLTDAEIAIYLDLTAKVIRNLEAGNGQ